MAAPGFADVPIAVGNKNVRRAVRLLVPSTSTCSVSSGRASASVALTDAEGAPVLSLVDAPARAHAATAALSARRTASRQRATTRFITRAYTVYPLTRGDTKCTQRNATVA
jgi:hypothetical protein